MSPKITPKDFFLWAGAMVSLWAGVWAFIALLFDYINYTLPNPLSYYPSDPWQSVSYEMAALIVLVPVFLLLMRLIRRDIARDPSRNDIWVRRWALYLTVFVAGATIVGDLITLVMYFLRGEELSAAFLLKVVVVLLVAGAGLLHFLSDLRGYWVQNPARAKSVNWATGAVVLVAIVAGFFIIGTPQQARQYRFDEQRVADVQQIQSAIVQYWQAKQKLPASLDELPNAVAYITVPTDPQTGESYGYRATGALAFEVCATFSHESRTANGGMYTNYPGIERPIYPTDVKDSWNHDAGRYCFERTIDPDYYPPLKAL